MSSCRTLLGIPDAPQLSIEGSSHPLRGVHSFCNLPYMLRGNTESPGDTTEYPVIFRGLFKLWRDTFNVVGQVEPLEYARKHMQGCISGSRGIFVPFGKKERSLVSQRIKDLRAKLGLNQTDFAKQLDTDQGSISKWEGGKVVPTPDALVRMASLADGVDKLFFLTNAGVPSEYFDGEKMVPELEMAAERVVSRACGQKVGQEPIWVPLYKDAVAAGEPRQVLDDIEDWIPVTKRLMPPGSDLRAVHVSGDSMAPIICDGYVVIVDAARQDPRHLVGRMIAAREGDGVTIKWLRKDRDLYLLVPQHTSQRFPVRVMREGDDWGIVGAVVKWFGYPPQSKF